MNFAIQSVAAAAITLCAALQPAFAADVPASSEPVTTAASDNPVPQIAQSDIGHSSMQTADAMPSTKPEPLDSGKRGARAAARQGPDALRRYVDRTRMIYALDIYSFDVSRP